jgi:hypothetical protein
VIELYAIG